jgi:signal transduction histidine kinase
LVPALRGLVRDLARTYSINIRFTSEDGLVVVPPDLALCLFRVTQESLMNVVKHSGATSAEVHLSHAGNGKAILLRVTDDGKGFDASRVQTDSLGIISMRERLRMIGGTLSIHPAQLRGTQVEANIPMAIDENSKKQAHHSAA